VVCEIATVSVCGSNVGKVSISRMLCSYLQVILHYSVVTNMVTK
jgi:hypothetical protein